METPRTGLSTQGQAGHATLLQALASWPAIATRAISDRISGLDLIVNRSRMVQGKRELEPVPMHPLQSLLNRPSPLHSTRQTLRLVAQHIVTVGEAFLLKVSGTGALSSMTRELWVMDPASVKPLVGGGRVLGYEVTDGQGSISEVALEDVVRIWLPDPQNIYTAEGFLNPQATAFDEQTFAQETVKEHFRHNASPSIVIEGDGEGANFSKEELERWNELWKQSFDRRRGSKRGVPAWLPGGFKAHELSAMGGMTDIVPILEFGMKQLMMAYGTPRAVVGDVQDANRANMESAQFGFDLFTIKPLTGMICDALSHQLASDFGDDLEVCFGDFIAKDKVFELERDKVRLQTKVTTVNEIRAEDGEEPVPWGDLPVGQFSDVPYTGEVFTPEPVPDALADFAEDDEPEEDEPDRLRGMPASLVATQEWQRVLDRERLFVPHAIRIMQAAFATQERVLMRNLRRAGLFRSVRILSDDDIRSIIASTFGPDEFRALYEQPGGIEAVRRAAYGRSGQDALKSAGFASQSFQFTPTIVANLRNQADQFRELVNDTTKKKMANHILSELAKGAAEGESLSQRANRVRRAVGEGMEVRRKDAERIARTEMLKANQKAQVDGFEQSGVVEKKRWNTSRDEFVRDAHVIDGQVVLLVDAFTLGNGEKADAPGIGQGGRSLSAENAINCRCFVTPIVED